MASKEAASARFARASSSSFRIDALLARQDPVHSSSSPSSESDSGHMSPRVVSPSHSSSSPCNLDEAQRCSSPAWARPPSPHCLTSMSIGQQSDMFNAGTSSLYAAMYGSHGSMGPNCRSNMPLLPHSAFHSPLHDLKGHMPSPGLSMDWLARAGLLYHRSPGMYTHCLHLSVDFYNKGVTMSLRLLDPTFGPSSRINRKCVGGYFNHLNQRQSEVIVRKKRCE